MNLSSVLIDNRRWLWLVVYSRLDNVQETEDVLQEVAVAAAGSKQDFDESQSAKNWLYRVAIRQVMLFRRTQLRKRKKLEQYKRDTPPIDSSECVDWICNDETRDQVRSAVRQLKPSDQQVLAMKYGEEYSCCEIAQLLGVTESTIQSRLLRARKRLRGLLVSQYQFEDATHE